MDIDQFWDIIDNLDRKKSVAESLNEALSRSDKNDLYDFDCIFCWLHYKAERSDVWGAAYIINEGCSDDGFTDFRNGLIMLGREVYEKVLINPDALADIDLNMDIRNEEVSYIASEVYEKKFGEEMPIKESSWDDCMGELWDFDDYDECLKRLPKLTRRYWK